MLLATFACSNSSFASSSVLLAQLTKPTESSITRQRNKAISLLFMVIPPKNRGAASRVRASAVIKIHLYAIFYTFFIFLSSEFFVTKFTTRHIPLPLDTGRSQMNGTMHKYTLAVFGTLLTCYTNMHNLGVLFLLQ